MTRIRKTTAVMIALLAGVSGCRTTDDAAPTTTTLSSSAAETAAGDQAGQGPARSVTVVRRGGLLAQRLIVSFRAGQAPPDGFTRADVTAVLSAGGRAARRTAGATTPADSCCDRYVYRVSIRWRDGTSRVLTAVQGDAQPVEVSRLLRLVEASGR